MRGEIFCRWRRTLFAIALVGVLAGCKSKSGSADAGEKVELYTSVDEPYVRPLVEQFQKQTGIQVTLITDAEASKSVGLAEKLRAEKDHPQADVWWSNECFLTIDLADDGVLERYDSPAAADIPEKFKDRERRWAGSVLRVRVLVSSESQPHDRFRPTHVRDLLRPELKGHIAIARPTAGTTGGHVAALYALWGRERAGAFFRGLHDNGVTLVGGNSIVAESVARGDVWAGLCDNDDAADAAANIGKLDAILPDQGEGEDGTLAMPSTVALVSHAPHPQAARRMIDFLLSREVGQKLIDAKFAWYAVRDASGHGKFIAVDYHTVAQTMPVSIRSATAILEGR